MKKLLILSTLFWGFMVTSKCQESGLEKNILGIQVGIIGIDFYNEYKLADKITLRSEVSLYPGVWGGSMYEKTGFMLHSGFTLQPKYYFNIDKRLQRGKNITNNSANYLSVQIRYIPDWLVISNYENIEIFNQLHFIPTFGIRRKFASNFNYEFKVGLGYGVSLDKSYKFSGTAFDLGFKLGYDF